MSSTIKPACVILSRIHNYSRQEMLPSTAALHKGLLTELGTRQLTGKTPVARDTDTASINENIMTPLVDKMISQVGGDSYYGVLTMEVATDAGNVTAMLGAHTEIKHIFFHDRGSKWQTGTMVPFTNTATWKTEFISHVSNRPILRVTMLDPLVQEDPYEIYPSRG